MVKPQKDLSQEEEATLFEMFDYFCSKMDMSKSFLDNAGILCMNKLFIELRKDKRKFNLD